jgi:hypothetical protein
MSRTQIDSRASVAHPCAVCGATRSCSEGPADEGTGRKYLCRGTPRSADFVPFKDSGHADFVLYRHQADLDRDRESYHYRRKLGFEQPRPVKVVEAKPVTDWTAVAAAHIAQISDDHRYELAERLGLPRSVFDTTPQLGYSREPVQWLDGEPIDTGFWVTPEADHTGKLIGLERRWRKEQKPRGEDKKAYAGSSRGLVLPDGWRSRPGPFLSVEGFSCAMAATAAGLCATGRPSKDGGVHHLVELLRDWPADRDIIIVGDNDESGDGQKAAAMVAAKLSEQLERPVKWSLPPTGFKDSRDFLRDTGDGVYTPSRWQGTPWAYRGAELLAHLVAVAVTVGATPARAVELVPTAAAPAVAPTLNFGSDAASESEYIKALLAPHCHCDNPRILIGKRPSTGRRGAVPFGCHKNACPVCGLLKKRDLFDASEGYVERLTNPVTAGDTTFAVYMTVVPSETNAALKRAVERKGGKYLAIDTTDPVGTGEAIAESEVSHLGHEKPEGITCPKCDTDEPHTLWTVLLPRGASPPRAAEFVHVTEAARVLSAWGSALTTTPKPAEDVTRFRFWRASRAWGERLEKPVGDFVPEGMSLYSQNEVRKLVEELRVATEFWFSDPKVQGRPVGWDIGPAASMTISLLLRGADAPHRCSIERVSMLAREWIDYLPEGLGDGRHVEKLLREHLWTGVPLVSITADLREADEQDRLEEGAFAEASALYAALRDSFRGREHEATGLLAELLA